MKIKAGLKFRLEADVEDYKQMLRDGWAGGVDGLVEQIEGDTVFICLVDGQAWRFGLKQFEEVTTPHDWLSGVFTAGPTGRKCRCPTGSGRSSFRSFSGSVSGSS